MLAFIADHQLFLRILSVPGGFALAAGITFLALRVSESRPAPVPQSPPPAFFAAVAAATAGPRHLADATAEWSAHEPRHADPYEPRHEIAAVGDPVELGQRPDGDITLVHADVADEPTLAGVAA